MAMTNTAEQQGVFIDVDTLNALPLAHVFVAIGPAKVVAEGVSVGPVMTDVGAKYLVRFDGKVAQLASTEAEVLELAGPSIRRHVGRIAYLRHAAEVEARRRAEAAAAKAACPGHEYVGHTIGRCLTSYICKHCGCGETVDSSD